MSKITPIEKYRFTKRKKMRYETLGDYIYTKRGIDIITYAKMSPLERKAVALHELIEQSLLELKGITPAMVDKWDTEDTNGAFDPKMYDKNVFYKKADKIALMLERIFIEWAGLKWSVYDRKLDKMNIKYK